MVPGLPPFDQIDDSTDFNRASVKAIRVPSSRVSVPSATEGSAGDPAVPFEVFETIHDNTEAVLRGVELSGAVDFVGEFPRTGELCAELDFPETLFARKNFGLDEMPYDGRHAWVRLTPEKIVSWDFRKLGSV